MITIHISGDSMDGQFRIIAGGLNVYQDELDPNIKGSEVYNIIGKRLKKDTEIINIKQEKF